MEAALWRRGRRKRKQMSDRENSSAIQSK